METNPPTLTYLACQGGWIRLRVVMGPSVLLLYATTAYNPFDDMLRWLEAIVQGAEVSCWTVGEESNNR